jgi:hypothetical protein
MKLPLGPSEPQNGELITAVAGIKKLLLPPFRGSLPPPPPPPPPQQQQQEQCSS